MKVYNKGKDTESNGRIRIKDKHGHFLGKIQDGTVYIYCKRCKEFYIVQNTHTSENKDDTGS